MIYKRNFMEIRTFVKKKDSFYKAKGILLKNYYIMHKTCLKKQLSIIVCNDYKKNR